MTDLIVWQVSLGNLLEIAVLLVSVWAVLYGFRLERRRDREVARREIYQRLELASIELFRFEADHLDLIRPLWDGSEPPADPAAYQAYRNYLSQILNLFEMAAELYCEGVLDEDVFASWVAWFQEIGRAPGFRPMWEGGLRDHYTGALCELMDCAIKPGDTKHALRETVSAIASRR